uniref:Uncharacterized protein n=1 Tax=Parastrongyloides trichosuri TaxID=131310 RepID=A0A0N4ZXE8_PARTI
MNPLKRKNDIKISPHDEQIITNELLNLSTSIGLPKGETEEETLLILFYYLQNAKTKGLFSKEASKKIQKIDLMRMGQVSMGMKSSGNPKMDILTKIIRLKYIEQSKHIQDCVNEQINKAQVLTADPKTNMSLAKVGF